MGTAAQIRNYRVRAGKSRSEVARHLGINEAWYEDLEHHDDELAATLTLFQALELASVLGVPLHDLVASEITPTETVSLIDLPSLIERRLAGVGISIEEFEEQVGWELREFMRSPLKVSLESPILFLQAVAEHLGLSWLSVIPDEHAG